ncbi:MAG: AAA family ATPase [Planctomycetota bacterium]
MGTIPGTGGGVGADGLESALVADIDGVDDAERWLIDELWSAEGVGICGGTPKTGKTWFALELAVAVASGKPVLGRFSVGEPGPTVVFPAEDNPRAVRDRVAGLAAHKGVELSNLPLHLITARALRLDEESDRQGLAAMLERVQPKLVVLDPLVRLHGGDENHLGHIAELLGFLRGLQREHGCSILLTHHIAKRRGAKGGQMGQALRGSGELHAWGDSNVYLTRTDDGLVKVQVEHRAAAPPEAFYTAVRATKAGAYVEYVRGEEPDELEADLGGSRELDARKEQSTSLVDQIVDALERSSAPLSQSRLRAHLRVRNQRLTEALHQLLERGVIERPGGKHRWRLVERSSELTSRGNG